LLVLDALDETIKTVLREVGGLEADEVDIAFEAPDREWAGRVGKPTVNCYLYDVRENLQLRETDWRYERQPNGKVVTKRHPPRRFDLSYVCTAWTSDIEDEHRLLWRVLSTMIRCAEIPRHLLQGPLARLTWPVITEVAQPDGLLRDPADVWSALDNRIRPSVNVVVTLPLDDSDPLEAPMVFSRTLRFAEFGRMLDIIQIAGVVSDEDGNPCPDVVVRVREHAHATVTTQDGRFWLAGLPPGGYTLIAESADATGELDVTVPGSSYDIVIGGNADTVKVGRRGEKAARAAKAVDKRAGR
jgi:hypothetical protein